MTGIKQVSEFDRQFQPRARIYRRPRLALRQRANEHPMAMFSVLVIASLSSMAWAPGSGPAFASMGSAPRMMDGARTTPKTDRLPMSETDIACRGQAWGVESETCLEAIAKDTGMREARKVRLIASAEPLRTTPNIF
ncbi:hypothetical protein WHT83_01185 [Aminobacter sp. P9b]|uniref:hypothetical protein n=1 Tax=unclassified Aminobacter TaxID=2644704 RepID=UPI000D351467|nr:hypothetical protein [Aminobacter sp. MSH1]AWC22123.1 hypothetical protein CO731_01579 [Aminobacter sp. MSH1]